MTLNLACYQGLMTTQQINLSLKGFVIPLFSKMSLDTSVKEMLKCNMYCHTHSREQINKCLCLQVLYNLICLYPCLRLYLVSFIMTKKNAKTHTHFDIIFKEYCITCFCNANVHNVRRARTCLEGQQLYFCSLQLLDTGST